MNRIKVSYGETCTPRQYESRRYDVELEIETNDETGQAARNLFAQARATVKEQQALEAEEVAREVKKIKEESR